MNRLVAGALLIVSVGFAASACSTSPSSASGFTWSVDSRSYTAAALGLTWSNSSKNTFSGFTCSSAQAVTISTPSVSTQFHTGTYSSPLTSTPATIPSDGFVIFISEGNTGSNGLAPVWLASAGTLTLTTVDSSHIVGSFDVTVVPGTNSNETGTAHAIGTFDVPPFTANSTICGSALAR